MSDTMIFAAAKALKTYCDRPFEPNGICHGCSKYAACRSMKENYYTSLPDAFEAYKESFK